MPRYIPSIPFEDCYGSVGNKTYFHRGKDCYYKKKPVCEFPGTEAQLQQLGLHQRALAAWRSVPAGVQRIWNEYAVDAPSKRPPYDEKAHISGYNLFVSAYHGFAQLGREHTPLPQRWVPFPDYFLDLESLQVVEDADLVLRFFCSVGDGTIGHRFRLLMKLELTRAGHGRRPGLQRNFLAEADCTDEDGRVTFRIPSFRETWQLSLPDYTAHCRFILLDNQTGYRSKYKMQSYTFTL